MTDKNITKPIEEIQANLEAEFQQNMLEMLQNMKPIVYNTNGLATLEAAAMNVWDAMPQDDKDALVNASYDFLIKIDKEQRMVDMDIYFNDPWIDFMIDTNSEPASGE